MKKFGLVLAYGLFWATTALPATLLPNGEQQFIDGNGAPYGLGTVCFYVPNTNTPKQTWQDPGTTVLNTSPCITLDANGRAVIYGIGQYSQKLFDLNGVLIWNKLTNSTGDSGSGTPPTPINASATISFCGGEFSINNASGEPIVLTLPGNPNPGDSCYFYDSSDTAGTLPITLNAGSNSFIYGGNTFTWTAQGGSFGVTWFGDVGKWGFN